MSVVPVVPAGRCGGKGGESGGQPFLWTSVIYDWDYDLDTKYGNGTQLYGGAAATSPHRAEPAPRDELGHETYDAPAPAPAPAPEPEPEPEPEYEEFDS